MREKYIPALITLIAGAVVSILDIYHKVELVTSLKRLLLVLIVFYIIGLTAKAIIVKAMAKKPKKEEQEETDPEAEEQDGENKEDSTENQAKPQESIKSENKKQDNKILK